MHQRNENSRLGLIVSVCSNVNDVTLSILKKIISQID